MKDVYSNDSRLKPIRACALMWGISRTGMLVGQEVWNRNNYNKIKLND